MMYVSRLFSPLSPPAQSARRLLRSGRRLLDRFNSAGVDPRLVPHRTGANAAAAGTGQAQAQAQGAGSLSAGAVRAASAGVGAQGVRPDANAIAAAAAALAAKNAEKAAAANNPGGSTFLSGGFGWTGSAFGHSGDDGEIGKGLLTSFEVGSTEEAILTISRTGLTEWDHHCQVRCDW